MQIKFLACPFSSCEVDGAKLFIRNGSIWSGARPRVMLGLGHAEDRLRVQSILQTINGCNANKYSYAAEHCIT